jgi:hypothetical protein
MKEKVQFTVKTPILLIFCGNTLRHKRSSEHPLFLSGRLYSPRYAPPKLEKLQFIGATPEV